MLGILNLALRDRGHVVLLHPVRPRRQIDLVEVEGDIRARILALAMRIVELLIIIHVLAAACVWLQVAWLVPGCRRSLCRGLRELLMEILIVNSRFDYFSIGGSRGETGHPHTLITQAWLSTTLFPLPGRIGARLLAHMLLLHQGGLIHNLRMATERIVLSGDVA